MAIYILSHDIQDIKDVMTAFDRMSTMPAPIFFNYGSKLILNFIFKRSC